MAFVLAVGGRDHQQVAHGQHLAVGRFVRKDTQAAAHVQLPDDVGRRVVLEGLVPIRTAVLAVAETLRVEAAELALRGDVVQTVPFDIRRARRRRQQELPQAALHARGQVLPEESAIRHPKGHEHAGLVRERGVQPPGVVGTHVDGIARDHGTAERLVSERDAPDDVPPGRRVPVDRRIARLRAVVGGGATEGAGTTGGMTGSPGATPAMRSSAHSASKRIVGSFAAALSASRAACAFGPRLPSAPAAQMRT